MGPWLSVITVVKDDAGGLRRTVDSLGAQDLVGVELVVIDSSADRASVPNAVEGVRALLPVTYAWHPAEGIYPAMNAGVARATGEFVYFLNSSDELASPTTVGRVRHALAGTGAAWAFGPVEIIEQHGRSVVTPPWDYREEQRRLFSRGVFPAHQGTFTRRTTLEGVQSFDTSYRVAADYATFLRLSQVSDPVELPFVIARFHEGGTSTQHWQESFREFHRARREILHPTGAAALREQLETARHFGLVFAHREVRPRLWWPRRRPT